MKHTARVFAEILRKDYYLGEQLKLRLKIDNLTDKSIQASIFKLTLLQNIKVHTKSWHCEFERT